MSEMQSPRWLELGDKLFGPVVGMGLATLNPTSNPSADLDRAVIPYLSLVHLVQCLQTGMYANEQGWHSAALCLIRQSIEALTLVDLGLQEAAYAEPLLDRWSAGAVTHGELRARLEKDVWHRYGRGLWLEPWAEFFGNLSRAVQPYAHYTSQLMGWQFQYLSQTGESADATQHLALFGLETYDALKASRITLLHGLVGWTLGRLLVEYGRNPDVLSYSNDIAEWGRSLGASKLLFKQKDWASELLPDMFFRPGVDWRDG
jgi:hypothetical protein